MTTIVTERLILRPWEDADAPALYRLARDPEVGPAAGWFVHGSEEQSLEVIRDVLRGPESYAITLRGTGGTGDGGDGAGSPGTAGTGGAQDAAAAREPAGTLVGAISLMGAQASDLVGGAGEYEAGYWVGRPFWGRGYCPEALRALIARARDELGARTIWAGYYTGNGKSRRVMEKCGMSFVRCDRDVDVPLLGERRDLMVMRLDLR